MSAPGWPPAGARLYLGLEGIYRFQQAHAGALRHDAAAIFAVKQLRAA